MATTKLWKSKSRLDVLINYVINGEKTEDKLYVSGINCSPEIAYQEMVNTKKQFFKTTGIEGFHGYQSFIAGEVSPELAHNIGVELAEKLWGDKYQVIVTTHLNTDNIHNHFAINSVSYIDGKRFCNTKKDYALMRKYSDDLCFNYGLSILKQEEKYTKFAKSPVYKEIMKDCIDYAIQNANDFKEFSQILESLNYEISNKNNKLSIRRQPYKQFTNIEKQFGIFYSKEYIEKRILETQPTFKTIPDPYMYANAKIHQYENIKKNYFQNKSILSLFILNNEKLYISNVNKAVKCNYIKLSPELIHESKKLDEFSNRVRFLCSNHIETNIDLDKFEKETYKKLSPLKSERESLWKKHKKANTEKDKKIIENQIADISKQIYPLNQNIKLCEDIFKRMQEFKEKEEIKEYMIENNNKKKTERKRS